MYMAAGDDNLSVIDLINYTENTLENCTGINQLYQHRIIIRRYDSMNDVNIWLCVHMWLNGLPGIRVLITEY